MPRLQITLDASHYELLERERARSGASLAALVRRAIEQTYESEPRPEERLALLEASFGAWSHRDADADADADWRELRPPLGPPTAV